MHIRLLEEADAEEYRRIRLNALETEPDAYGSTYERESEFALETFAERIKPTAGKFALGAAADEGSRKLIGIASFVRETGMKSAHKGNVYGVYVAPEARGKGAGKALMLDLVQRARSLEGMEQINLAVVSDNVPAKRLYESLGFEVYGVERRAVKYGGRYFDEELMTLRL